MDLFKRIKDLSDVYDDPSSMDQGSRPMFNERMQFDGGGSPLQKLKQEIVESMKPYAPGSVTEDQLQIIVKDITLDMTAEEAQASAVSNFQKLFGMANGGRAGYEDGGMLVKPSDDGSRPGYAGTKVDDNIRLRDNGNAFDVEIQRGKDNTGKRIFFRKSFNLKDYKNKTEALNAAKKYRDQKLKIPFKTGIQEPKYGSALDRKEYMKVYNEANRPLTDAGKLAKERDLKLKNFIGKKKKIKSSVLRDFILNDIGYGNYDTTKIKKKFPNLIIEKDIKTGSEYKPLTKEEIIKVKDNFDLPEGEKWDFKKYKNGLNGEKYPNLVNQIRNRLGDSKKYKIAANFSDPQGWMMMSMNRVYENEKKNKVKPKDLTYQPKFNNRGMIVGFTDNTATGQGRTFYGLKKNMREDGTEWRAHGDFNKVGKFINIANGVKEEPSKLLTKILDDKGITKLMGETSTLTLNDVLSHERFYNKLGETKPSELIRRQIVLHHEGGVGAGTDVARAAATKDIQLLTAANNSRANALEQIVRGTKKNPARKLNADEILELKNMGARITDFDGKVVGGGYTDPTKQFAAIEKKALEYAKGDQFNVKTVASYLERLGCGKAAGGRILMSNGGATLTKCAIKGQQKLNLGLTNGFDKTEGELAKKILQAGRGLGSAFALRNILGPAALGFTVAAEAGLVGYDMLATGKSFKEAVGSSLFNYALGDKTQIDNKKLRYQGYRDAGVDENQIGKISAYENAIDEMNNTFEEFNEENRLYNIAVNQKGKGRIPEQRYLKQKQKQVENFYNQADKDKALIQDLARTQTEDRLDKAIDPMVPALMSDADAKRKAMQMTKPSTVAFGNVMDKIFPKAGYREDREKAINYMPAVQEYYRGNQFAGGGIAGLSGGDPEGAMTRSMNPDSQGLSYLFNRAKKV